MFGKQILFLALALFFFQSPAPEPQTLTPTEGDFTTRDFRFESGESLPELKIHYRTLGKPNKDANGIVRNAVLTELGILERETKRLKNGRFVLIPIGDETRGHGTHSLPEIWKAHLAALLESTNQ